MATTSHTVALTINGVDRTSLLLRDSVYIRHTANNHASTCDFTIKDGSTAYQPNGWHAVSLTIDSVVVFGGFIVEFDASVIGVSSTRQTNWKIQCRDWSALLDGAGAITGIKYTGLSDASIIDGIFSTYLSGEGFDSTTHVTSIDSDIDIRFDNVTVREALNQLAARVNAVWFIAPDKSLYWNVRTGFASAAFNIDTATPNGSTSFDVAYGSISRQIDVATIVNKVTVVGGYSAAGVKQTDVFTGNGTKDTFGKLTRRVSSMWSISYTISGVASILYSSQIGYEPQDTLTYESGTFTGLVNLENGTVRIRSSTGAVPDNATSVTVVYYYSTLVTTTAEHTGSQNFYGRIFEKRTYDESLTSLNAANEYALRVLNQYAFARETVAFSVYEHGLLPGTLIQINCPSLSLANTLAEAGLALEYNIAAEYVGSVAPSVVLTEDSNTIVMESYGGTSTYLIQEVEIQPAVSKQGLFMMVARVSCGDRQHSILDIIQQSTGSGTSAGSGPVPAKAAYGNLSAISGNLGEVVAGRALFTDGGTAQFSWSSYGGHTGAVVGLEDINSNTYGAVYILDAGTVRAKLGRMTGMGNVGTITPTGWGLWTNNGFFSGMVAAGTVDGSTINGGTITGGFISGGTVSGGLVTGGTVSGALLTGGTANITVGNIGGFVIAANQIYSNGGTISTGAVVNSSNPGVYMGTAGLFGYGTLGLTFAIYTDPARAPWFSSGTINNVVYEVYETAILRTSANPFTDGGIQLDNSGIFGINPTTGTGAFLTEDSNVIITEDSKLLYYVGINFMLDTTTGNVYAEGGQFAGVVYATDGVFTGSVFARDGSFTGTVTATAGIFTGTVSASTITGGTVSGSQISGGVISGGVITGNSLSGNTISGETITGSTITGNTITGGTVSGALLTGGTVSAGGGTVTLDGGGIYLSDAAGTAYDTAYLQWRKNGTILSGVATYLSGGVYYWNENIGKQNSANGAKVVTVAGTVGNTQLAQYDTNMLFNVSGSEAFYVDSSKFRVDGNLGNGWISVTTFGSNIISDAVFILKYRKFGDMVILSGAVNCTAGTITAGNQIFNLPSGYRPATYNRIVTACQNGVPISVNITTGGDFRSFTNYTNTSGVLYVDGIVFFTT